MLSGNIHHRLAAIFFFLLLPTPHHSLRRNACGKRSGPCITWSQTLTGKLLLRVNAQAHNGPFKSVPENFTQTPVCSPWDVPFLSLPLVSFGHRSAFLAHSFTGHRFCLTLPNTCLSASVWNSIFSDIDWIFMHIFFFLSRQVVFESPSHASLFNHVSVKNISTYFSGKALLSLFFKVRAAYCCVCVLHCLKLLSTPPSLFLLVDYLSNQDSKSLDWLSQMTKEICKVLRVLT